MVDCDHRVSKSISITGVEEDTHGTYAAHRREHSYDVSVGSLAPVRSLLAQRWATSRILSYSCALDLRSSCGDYYGVLAVLVRVARDNDETSGWKSDVHTGCAHFQIRPRGGHLTPVDTPSPDLSLVRSINHVFISHSHRQLTHTSQHLVGTGKLYVLCSHLIVAVIAGRLLGRLTCRRSLPATQKLPWEPHQDAVYCSPVALIFAMLG